MRGDDEHTGVGGAGVQREYSRALIDRNPAAAATRMKNPSYQIYCALLGATLLMCAAFLSVGLSVLVSWTPVVRIVSGLASAATPVMDVLTGGRAVVGATPGQLIVIGPTANPNVIRGEVVVGDDAYSFRPTISRCWDCQVQTHFELVALGQLMLCLVVWPLVHFFDPQARAFSPRMFFVAAGLSSLACVWLLAATEVAWVFWWVVDGDRLRLDVLPSGRSGLVAAAIATRLCLTIMVFRRLASEPSRNVDDALPKPRANKRRVAMYVIHSMFAIILLSLWSWPLVHTWL